MSTESLVSVLFEVPEFIKQGLTDGTMKLWGGVVRYVADGQIVTHLAPGKLATDALQSGAPIDPSVFTNAIGHAQSAALVASGIGAISLAVKVGAFAVMKRKLDAIVDQLDHVARSVGVVKEDVEWIKSLHMAELRADIDSASDLAARAFRQQDIRLFQEARTKAHKVRRHIMHVMRGILKAKRCISLQEQFEDLTRASLILANMEVQCDEPVEGASQATAHLRATVQELDALLTEFQKQCRDYSIDTAERIRIGPSHAKAVVARLAELANSVEGLRGIASEIETRASLGISAEQWRKMTSPEGSGWVTCVFTTERNQSAMAAPTRLEANAIASDSAALRPTRP